MVCLSILRATHRDRKLAELPLGIANVFDLLSDCSEDVSLSVVPTRSEAQLAEKWKEFFDMMLVRTNE
jgi:ABC-type phosphate/phosphonate transport system substrate-binding protein